MICDPYPYNSLRMAYQRSILPSKQLKKAIYLTKLTIMEGAIDEYNIDHGVVIPILFYCLEEQGPVQLGLFERSFDLTDYRHSLEAVFKAGTAKFATVADDKFRGN